MHNHATTANDKWKENRIHVCVSVFVCVCNKRACPIFQQKYSEQKCKAIALGIYTLSALW